MTPPDPLRAAQLDEFMGWLFRDGALEPPRREYDAVEQRLRLLINPPDDPTVCEVCGALADGEPGRCHRHFRSAAALAADTAPPIALYRCRNCGRNEYGCECPGPSFDAADTAPLGLCWFCKQAFVVDALIAGYDTWDEQRLACLACNERMQGNWRLADTPKEATR